MMPTPNLVRLAGIFWFAAVACGVAESALAIRLALSQGELGAETWIQIGIRVVVYPSLAVLVVLFWRGHRWARNALAVLFTGIGLTSLVAPPLTALFAGESFFHALSGDQLGWSFVLVRLIHVVSVLSASVLMFSAGANAYFARHRRAIVPAR